jgi:hypothetical protein
MGWRFGQRAWRRRHQRSCGGIFEHRTTDEVRDEILSHRQSHPLFEWQQHLKPTEFLRFRDGIHAFKMKNCLTAMILAQPARFQRQEARLALAIGITDKNLLQSCEPFRKISEELGRNFAFVAARPQDARNQDPAWSFGAQWKTEPFSGSCQARAARPVVRGKRGRQAVNPQGFPA